MSLPERPRAVITGGGSGLGRALCIELGRRRARVLVGDVDVAGAEATARLVTEAGGEARVERCDVSKLGDVERLADVAEEAFGEVDLVVNNAGVAVAGPMGSVPMEDWHWIMGVNLWGVIHGCHVFVPRLRARRAGHVLNVASAAGLICVAGMGPYNVTKAGVVALSETLHSELSGAGVGVTVLCPTFFKTNIAQASRAHGDLGAATGEKLMGRARVQADGVARVALRAVDEGKLYALPHANGQWGWRLKRLDPERFHGVIVPRLAGWIGKIAGREA